MMIETKDSLEYLKQFNDYEFDINYSDPPYQLGSEVIVRKDGMVDYKKSVDFMNKWGGLSGDYWNAWFKEAYRTLKHGGYCIMFGMDRQLLLFKYYANLAGFEEQQSLYWYFISNFPKATDLSKQIDKNAGAEREIVGQDKCGKTAMMGKMQENEVSGNIDITAPSTDLAKKYEGYKYSISPLKQTNETILIFRKPYKSGSCLHDTLAFENGDNECRCGALNIDGNRVGTESRVNQFAGNKNGYTLGDDRDEKGSGFWKQDNQGETETTGRYPSQTLCDSNTAEVLDKQSGILKSGDRKEAPQKDDSINFCNTKMSYTPSCKGSIGGCSKILHKCNYEKEDYDIYNYQPKVSKSERNAGCDEFEEKLSASSEFRPNHLEKALNGEDGNPYGRWKPLKNNHPTLKPIALNEKILKLFKTPNDDKIVYPFAGSGSEVIGGLKAGFTNWVGCEINPEYVEIAKARIEHWTKQDNQLTMFDIERECI